VAKRALAFGLFSGINLEAETDEDLVVQFQNRIGHGGQIGQVERFDHALLKIARRQHLDLAGDVSFIQDALLNRLIRLCPVERCFQAFD
jgi:hypothetical protein